VQKIKMVQDTRAQLYKVGDRPTIVADIVTFDDWLESFKSDWRQGEHVSLIGQTGTGKTTVAHNILDARDFVCVIAAKRFDDTLQRFKWGHRYGRARYDVVRKWPPEYNQHKVIFWKKPEKLSEQKKVALAMHDALNEMYRAGGWCIYADDTGYLTGFLGLGGAMVVLLNQGRSAHISVVCAIQRPRSLMAKVPVEALTQCRHHIIYKYTNEDEIKTCAQISGLSFAEMKRYQYNLHTDPDKGYSDFLYIGHGKVQIVRNTEK
jgi:ABC-type dipeptide/oligopeptide/nickel transport system ATPase subunit